MTTAAVLALACTACGRVDSAGSAAGDGQALTAQECDAVLRKGADLHSEAVHTQAYQDILAGRVRACVEHRDYNYTRKQYACMMKATTVEDYAECGQIIHPD